MPHRLLPVEHASSLSSVSETILWTFHNRANEAVRPAIVHVRTRHAA